MTHQTTTRRAASLVALLLTLALLLGGCNAFLKGPETLSITNGDTLVLRVGETLQLETDLEAKYEKKATWESSNTAVTVSETGLVSAVSRGVATVTVTCAAQSDSITIAVSDGEAVDFYGDYVPATSHEEALARSARGELSGLPYVPDQAPQLSAYQPKDENGTLIRNNDYQYPDENTYVVVDALGIEVFRVYRGGGYITLEEVAAYVFAFGDVPANYISGKNQSPTSSIWGEYLRLNHSKFSGNTKNYPYEPVLPRISGCGGDLQYYEIDIGTTGTDCDPAYIAAPYNDGSRITRGAARIVYTRFDINGNKIIDADERFVFYTYNHYNDFQEYLNYYGGFGVMFGNITGGGTISSKKDYNPTPYVPSVRASLQNNTPTVAWIAPLPFEPRKFTLADVA